MSAPVDRKVTRPAWFIEIGDVIRYKRDWRDRYPDEIGIVQEVISRDKGGKIGLRTGPIIYRWRDRNDQVEWLGHVDPSTWSLNPIYDAVRLEFQR